MTAATRTGTADEAHADRSVAFGDPAAWTGLVASHYENFPVGSLLAPKAARRHLHRIYAFARTADDLADEFQDAEGLRWMGEQLDRHIGSGAAPAPGAIADPVPLFADLAATIHELDLDPDLFRALLDAFTQDLTTHRYPEEAALFDYCTRSADPVGRLVLRVFRQESPERDALSDRICTGLQLLNHLQDIAEDLRDRDRIYLPTADLARFGVAVDDLRAPRATPAVRRMVAAWTGRVADLLGSGWPLIPQVRLRWELRAILAGAAQVLRRIRAADHDVLARHIRLSKGARAASLLRGVFVPSRPRALAATPQEVSARS